MQMDGGNVSRFFRRMCLEANLNETIVENRTQVEDFYKVAFSVDSPEPCCSGFCGMILSDV